MKMKKTVLALILALSAGVGSGVFANPAPESKSSSGSESRVLAYLDGKPITYSELKAYAEQLSNPKYKKMLESREGIKELLNLYINHRIILQEAKKEISARDSSLRAHSAIDEDSRYIIAYLARIGEKVRPEISDKEVSELAEKEGITRKEALGRLISRRAQLYLKKLRSKHKVEFLVK